MTNPKRRRQTRSRRTGGWDPADHNEHRALERRFRNLSRTFAQVNRTLRNAMNAMWEVRK